LTHPINSTTPYVKTASEFYVRSSQHITGQFRDESLQAINCTGTDNQTENKQKKICKQTQKKLTTKQTNKLATGKNKHANMQKRTRNPKLIST